ncbi:MAG: hypothetical protein JWO45_1803 [Spartobacteria bacterium]|nr:hypothetical protein [Spartobacteria bacterium]
MIYMLHRLVAFAFLTIAASSSLVAQEALTDGLAPAANAPTIGQPPPSSAWLDLRQNAPAHSKPQSAPSWVEAVGLIAPQTKGSTPTTVFRIRVIPPAGDYRLLFFRLFFEDKPDLRPQVIAWDESGTQVVRSGQLGSGIDLPSSDSVIIPMMNIAAIDVEVPGDGKTVRGAYLDWMTSSEVVHPLNAPHRDVIPEPFSSLPPLHAPEQDVEEFGTVKATLASEAIRIGPSVAEAASFQFGIEAQPLLALLTFEVASARIDSPPEVYVNGVDIGPATLTLPELADPGFRGQTESLVKKMQFHYTGWLRGQKLVPADAFNAGTNDILVLSGAGSANAAIRATQIELKYIWDKSDYLVQPGH